MSSIICNPLGRPVRSLRRRPATWDSVMASSGKRAPDLCTRAPPSRRHHSPSFSLARCPGERRTWTDHAGGEGEVSRNPAPEAYIIMDIYASPAECSDIDSVNRVASS